MKVDCSLSFFALCGESDGNTLVEEGDTMISDSESRQGGPELWRYRFRFERVDIGRSDIRRGVNIYREQLGMRKPSFAHRLSESETENFAVGDLRRHAVTSREA